MCLQTFRIIYEIGNCFLILFHPQRIYNSVQPELENTSPIKFYNFHSVKFPVFQIIKEIGPNLIFCLGLLCFTYIKYKQKFTCTNLKKVCFVMKTILKQAH